MNAEDACVVQYLKYYTFLTLEEIACLEKEAAARPENRGAQLRLASEVVKFVHGASGLAEAEKATSVFFGAAVEDVSDEDLQSIFSEVPRVELSRDKLAGGLNIVDLLASTPLWKGKNDVRRSIEQRGAYLNNRPVETSDLIVDSSCLATPGALVIRKGKKNYAMVRIT
jgi:tyrosyl-tRNA synthetase